MHQISHPDILENPGSLVHRIASRLDDNGIAGHWPLPDNGDGIRGSAVLFLLTEKQVGTSGESEICLLLNKRSQKVLQPGDLCCPGGGVARLDSALARLMPLLPFSPFFKWAKWDPRRVADQEVSEMVALLLATGLREAWEEMRLNPLKVSFLGPLPVQQLLMFERKIYPLVAWVPAGRRLKANWEVERIVHIPLRRLLDRRRYGRYLLTFKNAAGETQRDIEFPCFIHRGRQGTEILWGATFRITVSFLSLVFGFSPPDPESLPLVRGKRGEKYLNGSLMDSGGHDLETYDYDD